MPVKTVKPDNVPVRVVQEEKKMQKHLRNMIHLLSEEEDFERAKKFCLGSVREVFKEFTP